MAASMCEAAPAGPRRRLLVHAWFGPLAIPFRAWLSDRFSDPAGFRPSGAFRYASRAGSLATLLLALALAGSGPAGAGEASAQVTLLDLPFRVTAMRGPGSEVALAVATSGAVPRARPRLPSADPKAAPPPDAQEADLVVVWGEDGGAALTLVDGEVRASPIAAEAVEGFAAAETPRGAVPGSRRAAAGALNAYLSGPVRASSGASGQAAGLTIRERQPVAMSGDPRPVPIATATVAPGAERVFAARHPRILTLGGRSHILAVLAADGTARPASALAILSKDEAGRWALAATSPLQAGDGPDGAPLAPAAIADFSGAGRPQVAALRAPDGAGLLQLWAIEDGALSLMREAPGYAGARGPDEADLAAALPPAASGPAELALPVADRTALALISLKDGIRERARIALPAPAAHGVSVLGRGEGARILVGLSDGRLAVVTPAAKL